MANESRNAIDDFEDTPSVATAGSRPWSTQADGFLPTQVRGWLLLRNSRLWPQERAAILSATFGDTSFSKVSEKLRSQWSDSDLAVHDRRGKSLNHDGHRKGHDRRHGNTHPVDLSDETCEETSPKQPPNTPDGAFGNDGVYYTGELWDQLR